MQSKPGLPAYENGRKGPSHGIMLTKGTSPECLNRQTPVTNCHTTTPLAKKWRLYNIVMFYILRKSVAEAVQRQSPSGSLPPGPGGTVQVLQAMFLPASGLDTGLRTRDQEWQILNPRAQTQVGGVISFSSRIGAPSGSSPSMHALMLPSVSTLAEDDPYILSRNRDDRTAAGSMIFPLKERIKSAIASADNIPR
ncbi:hypothetical protein [Janthinobacterium sp. BJB401]|uniref:hypothetical protein n=1 Tax=Janthinobacterium sp. BJB401 TaxID=2745934 RepID=UPI0015962E69|nr:hypothetical protein [Janthinobacterium sp. BJB401]NVI85601.1 hypothetical protein [Janthinobacterium sp. BJB401]